jgi:adenylate kinase
MRIALTGTPGTGKTTVADQLDLEMPVDVVHLNTSIHRYGLTKRTDRARGTSVVDLEAVARWLDERVTNHDTEMVVIESHLAHLFDVDRVVVLRCSPDRLGTRLETRETSSQIHDPPKTPEMVAQSADENAEAEALDVILSGAVERHGLDTVYEVDTTDRSPKLVAADVEAVIMGTRSPSAGTVDFSKWLL